jgi:hypothetical protein
MPVTGTLVEIEQLSVTSSEGMPCLVKKMVASYSHSQIKLKSAWLML